MLFQVLAIYEELFLISPPPPPPQSLQSSQLACTLPELDGHLGFHGRYNSVLPCPPALRSADMGHQQIHKDTA